MRIRLAVIPPDELTVVQRLTGDLRTAVNAGDMDGVHAATNGLLAVTAKRYSMDITEEEWRGLLAETRSRDAMFQAHYIVPGQPYTKFFPQATADTIVLQFPFSESESEYV